MNFKSLGAQPTAATRELETFSNPETTRDYTIHMETNEFSCICPVTGQPDFAELYLTFVPNKLCVELKSFKMYLWSFRDEGTFHEAVTNKILGDLVTTLDPKFIRLRAKFNVRGGIYTNVVAEHRHPDWKAPEEVNLP